MHLHGILNLSQQFYQVAAVQSIMSLRDPKIRKYLGADTWFGEELARTNSDAKLFAIFDNQNVKAISDLDIAEHPGKEYFEHPRMQELFKFIVRSFNKHFPELNGLPVLEHMQREYYDDIKNYPNPTFMLVHDLIHTALEKEFLTNLINRERTGYSKPTSLVDEIKEDLASILSGFTSLGKPYGYFAQGLGKYIGDKFAKYLKRYSIVTEQTVKAAIEETFHQAKAELRQKIEALHIRRGMKKNELEQYRQVEPASKKIKQLIDGILSKYKYKILQVVPRIIEDIDEDHHPTDVFAKIAEETYDFYEEYMKRLEQADIMDPVDSSAMRAWMLECFSKMREVRQYFKNEYEKEFFEYYEDEDDEE